MAYSAKIVLDSVNPVYCRLTTMEVTLPRIVLAEFNTHCMFARNSASSRAIPVSKQIEKVETDPFIPIWWGKHQPGMQANEELSLEEIERAKATWLNARDVAVSNATTLLYIGLHKQITNRLLEPFMWHTILFTGTADAYSNFFHLRRSKDAQPEIKRAADLLWEAYHYSTPQEVNVGGWHTPLIDDVDRKALREDGLFTLRPEIACELSTARCARVSYLTHGGKRDFAEDLKLYGRLKTSGHWSPFEHVASAMPGREKKAKYTGWWSWRHYQANEYVTTYIGDGE